MNLNFEKDIIAKLKDIAQQKKQGHGQQEAAETDDASIEIVHEESLAVLKGLKVAIDANILLAQLDTHSNPKKFIQEGGSSLDLGLQNALVKLIK